MITELPLYNKILILFIDFIAIWLAIIVYNSNRRGKLNKIFFGMIVSMFLWVNFAYLARLIGQQNHNLGLMFLKIAWAASPFLFVSLYFLVVFYLNKEKQYLILNKIIFLSGLITFLIAIFTNLVIKEIEFIDIDLVIIYGKGILLFLGVILFIMYAPLSLLFREYVKCSQRERIKMEYLLVGIFIFYLANIIFGIVFPIFFKIVHLYWIGDYSAIILLIFIAYAITKHNLMGIKILLTQTLIVIIAIILLLDIFALSDNLTMQILKVGILIAFLYFSRGMIESVKKEKEARKELQKTYRKVNRYARKLEKANLDLKELLEIKNNFLHITSHQLRTPLTVIRGMLSMWRAGDFDNLSEKEQKEKREKIYLSAERLNNITNDMLDAMEVEGKFLKFNLERVSLENIIRETMDELKPNYDRKGLYLKLNVKGRLPKIKVEPKYLKQALMNLLDNAEKYTLKGGVEIKIKKEKEFILIEIKDTGIGIAKNDQKKLFQKFSRTENAIKQNTTGSGLGLFIAKQIIDEHQGKIEISSEGVGKGTTVKVWLLR